MHCFFIINNVQFEVLHHLCTSFIALYPGSSTKKRGVWKIWSRASWCSVRGFVRGFDNRIIAYAVWLDYCPALYCCGWLDSGAANHLWMRLKTTELWFDVPASVDYLAYCYLAYCYVALYTFPGPVILLPMHSLTLVVYHCKKGLVILTSEWLPWL